MPTILWPGSHFCLACGDELAAWQDPCPACAQYLAHPLHPCAAIDELIGRARLPPAVYCPSAPHWSAVVAVP
jgi:predicted amidophosphoribosyltransferase